MKPYQLHGLSFLVYLLRNCASGILGDEMGLGKTLQTLALFQYVKEHTIEENKTKMGGCSLIVCPLSVLESWMNEARRWTPDLRVIRLHGAADQRAAIKAEINSSMMQMAISDSSNTKLPSLDFRQGYDLIITTYEMYLTEQKWLKGAFIWRFVVLDEGHKIKNSDTELSRALQTIKAEHRLLLTGYGLAGVQCQWYVSNF